MRYKIETKNQSYTAAGTVAYDSSSSARTVTTNGASISTAQKKYGTHSLLFDGTNDYLEVSDHADWDSLTDFTLECWYRNDTPSMPIGQSVVLVGRQVTSGSGGLGWSDIYWYLGESHATGTVAKIYFHCSNNGGSGVGIEGTTTISDNNWHHLAVVRNGTSFKTYVDGTSDGSATATLTLKSGSDPVTIGKRNTNGWFAGNLDEIRISNTARYTSNFTAPTAAFTSDANTKLLIHGDPVAESGKVTKIHGTSLAWK
tara:strand:- start:17 stop:787 length:771 start_codon:yes stop_codon:yes gene_type:complete